MSILCRFKNAHKRVLTATVLGMWLATTTPVIFAQSVCLPLPRLLTTMPMGGQAGTQLEVTITGDHIDQTDALYFSHPGLTAVAKQDADGQLVPNAWMVTIAADCPPGLYEARVMSRLGISSSRVFSVGTLPEVRQTSSNTSLETAMELNVNSVCNAVMTTKAVDHYSFNAVKGQRCLIHCAARDIDSKLNAVLIIADAMGRDLQVERRGGAIDFVASQDGRHVIKVHELTFGGGPGYFYRLTLQELPADAPLPQFASTRTVSSFSWPPAGLAADPVLAEAEPNDGADTAQKIELPCDISGSFFPAADVDMFEFTATKGDVWWVEVASERLGRPTDPSIVVQHVRHEGDQEHLTDIVELTDIPSPVKVSSNGYAYDGPPYNGGSADIIGRLEITHDGLHRLQITDLFGGTRNDERNRYRLIIRRAEPDFALIAWAMHMELRNGDRNALSKPFALRAGATMALEVVAVRRDGFDGPIELTMENLPDGVTAMGLTIPAGQSRGILLITADQNAPRGMSFTSFHGKAVVNDQEVIRPVSTAAMAWPVPDAWQEIPAPRLVTDIPVSVTDSEVAPISITASEQDVWEVVAGEKLTIPLMQTRRDEFSGSTLQLKTFGNGFERNPQFNIDLTAAASQAVIDTAALKVAPGEYTIAFYGSAVAKYRYDPNSVATAASAHQQAEERVQRLTEEKQKLMAAADAATAADAGTVADTAVDNATREESAAAAAATSATSEEQDTASTALTEVTAQLQAAEAALAESAKTLKTVTDRAAAKDTADIVVTEPIRIRVRPAQ